MTTIDRRLFIRLVGGGVVTGLAGLAGCAPAMPPEALEAWRGPGPAPDSASAGDPRRWLLAHALLAPHSHNLQSWIADLRSPGDITLYCDRERLLPETDPFGRQIVMSHGTFLELLDLAARERGLRAEITPFPQGAFDAARIDDRPVAHVRLRADPAVPRDPLFAQILRRHTNREAYDLARPVAAEAWAAMAAAAGPGVRFGHVEAGTSGGAAALERHRAIARDAWRIELTTPRTILESYRVLRVGAAEIAQHRDGISLTDPMIVALTRLGLFDRSVAPAPDDRAVRGQIEDFDARIAATPAFLWMTTPANDRATQLQAGRAYARVQLAATAHGVVMQPLQQALQEYPEQRELYRAIHALVGAGPGDGGATVQMWARVGHLPAAASPATPAPRRPLDAIIRA